MADGRMSQAERRGPALLFTFDGEPIDAYQGESVAAALWAAGVRTLRRSSARGEPRGIYCNMGICFDCLVRIGGREVRACTTPVLDGMVVESAG